MGFIGDDLQAAVRALRRTPGFTALVAVTLAVGIAGSTMAFAVVNAVLVAPLSFAEPERLVFVQPTSGARLSAGYLYDWRESTGAFTGLAGWHDTRMTLAGTGDPVEVNVDRTTVDFFTTLRAQASIGRAYVPQAGRAQAPDEVVLSHALWQQRYGGRTDIVGTRLLLDGTPWTVVGVMPERFGVRTNELPESHADIWVPFTLEPGNRVGMGGYLNVVGRLNAGVSTAQAEGELNALSRRIEEAFPSYSRDWSVRVMPLHDATVANVRVRLLVMFGAVGLLLLVSCGNVAHLVSSRGVRRRDELAVRLSLGATGGRIFRQLMAEHLVLAIVGGMLGLWLAVWLMPPFVTVLAPSLDLPRTREIALDARTFLFAGTASLAASVLFGLLPAVRLAWFQSPAQLQRSRGATTSPGHARLGSLVVASEVAIGVMLLVFAGLVTRSVVALMSVDPGFRPDGAITMRTTMSETTYDTPERMRQFGMEMIEAAANVPGVTAAGTALYLPLSQFGAGGPFTIEGRPPLPQGEEPGSWQNVVGGRFFEAMGMPLVSGRTFSDTDTEHTMPVVIISERLARQHWPDSNPIGAFLTWRERDGSPVTREVIGVVGDVRYQGLAVDPPGTAYFWFRQAPRAELHFVVRAAQDPLALVTPLRARLRDVAGEQAISDARPLSALVAGNVRQARTTAALLASVSAMALALTIIGIYAVVAFGVAQRTREIGVRMALGASKAGIVRLVMTRGLAQVLAGVAAGTAGALATSRVVSSLLFGVAPTDGATLATVALLLTLTGAMASAVPAFRAARVAPTEALRAE